MAVRLWGRREEGGRDLNQIRAGQSIRFVFIILLRIFSVLATDCAHDHGKSHMRIKLYTGTVIKCT